jgi:4-aminobutyrate aminotransferase-like enzyme
MVAAVTALATSPVSTMHPGGMVAAVTALATSPVSTMHPGGFGGTYGGNPIACAAALASI